MLEENIELYEEDATIHSLQLSFLQILGFLEKIIETELNIMQGTGFGDFQHHTHQNSNNELAAHGQTIQARAILKEQRQIIKFIRLERF
jgi:hypothetical protein